MAETRLNGMVRAEVTKLHEEHSKNGFDVCYEEVRGEILANKYLDISIRSETSAWKIAKALAEAEPGRYVNIYVVYSRDIDGLKTPVFNFKDHYIENRWFS